MSGTDISTVLPLFLGPVLIGSWATASLYAAEVIETVRYFRYYQGDGYRFKGAVMLSFLIDTVGMAAIFYLTYQDCVGRWGDPNMFQIYTWSHAAIPITTQAPGVIMQMFLLHRYYTLTKNIYVVIFFLLVSFTAFGAMLASTGIVLAANGHLTSLASLRPAIYIWNIASAAADIGIAAALIIHLNRVRSRFPGTKKLITRLTVNAIQTGAAGSVVALISTIVYLSDQLKWGQISFGINFTLGRIYTLTMLRNLNARKRSSGGTSRGGSTTRGTSGSRGEDSRMHISMNDHIISNLHIQNATVRTDEGDPAISSMRMQPRKDSLKHFDDLRSTWNAK